MQRMPGPSRKILSPVRLKVAGTDYCKSRSGSLTLRNKCRHTPSCTQPASFVSHPPRAKQVPLRVRALASCGFNTIVTDGSYIYGGPFNYNKVRRMPITGGVFAEITDGDAYG